MGAFSEYFKKINDLAIQASGISYLLFLSVATLPAI